MKIKFLLVAAAAIALTTGAFAGGLPIQSGEGLPADFYPVKSLVDDPETGNPNWPIVNIDGEDFYVKDGGIVSTVDGRHWED